MSERVTLVGLDFGTTTSSAVVADATLLRNAVTGRTDLSQVRERFRSEMIFTPLDGERIDIPAIEAHLDAWLGAAGVRQADIFGGGALLTGLTAQQENASRLVELVRRRLGDAFVATADDPSLESWLSFLGSCAGLSRAHPDQAILNLDIGGGTTNLALGLAGQVQRTGCLFVGARHVQVVPGTYRIVRLSRYAQALLAHLRIAKGVGDTLTDANRNAIIGFYIAMLEAAVLGNVGTREIEQLHVQVTFQPPPDAGEPIVTFSGGVGELIYAHARGEPWPGPTQFGDLGIDLAKGLLNSRLARDVRTLIPSGGGRATVFGLLRHNTEISGSTLFLPRPDVLPLTDLPVLGELSPGSTDADLSDLIGRVHRSPRGGCLVVSLANADAATVRTFGQRLAATLRQYAFPADHPLVLLVRENLGKVLGLYVSDWGQSPAALVVLDEIAVRDAHYVHIGALRQQGVPVSFHGLYEPGGKPCAP